MASVLKLLGLKVSLEKSSSKDCVFQTGPVSPVVGNADQDELIDPVVKGIVDDVIAGDESPRAVGDDIDLCIGLMPEDIVLQESPKSTGQPRNVFCTL